MLDVIGVGASSIDFVYQLPATPRPDSVDAKLRISRHLLSPGGQTATVLCTCAALGLRTSYIGTVGNDAHAETLLDALRSRGVGTEGVVFCNAPSPYAVILVDEQHGERIVLWDRSPAASLRPSQLTRHDFSTARVVHVDDVDVEAALYAASAARAAGVRVTSDIEQATGHTAALWTQVDVAIFAEHVPQALAPSPTPEQSLQRLDLGANQMLCVTRGARGAVLRAGGDTTGAGDVFRGAFITGLLRGDAPGEILAFANAAAAASCTRLGAITGVPTEADIAALVRNRPATS
jgi:sugar/nucleoside kinase (ribokinase family)